MRPLQRRPARGGRFVFLLGRLGTAAILAGLSACAADVQDGVGPRVSYPDVEGKVMRATAPAAGLDVEVREPAGGDALASGETDGSGAFAFAGIPSGRWELKISGAGPGDFASVSREFQRLDGDPPLALPAFDIHAYEAGLTAPHDDAHIPRPSPLQPVIFRWVRPDFPDVTARVLLYDAGGAAVWFSARFAADSALWNGLGNQGGYVARLVPPGAYTWRVKFDLRDSTEARTPSRGLTLEVPS